MNEKKVNPVFVIEKAKVKEIIEHVANKGNWYFGNAFGESNPESMMLMVDAMPCINNTNNLNMSKVTNKIKDLETCKMVGHANCGINLIIKLMNEFKFPHK